MQAYLAVYLGNFYGRSWNAASIAYEELSKITSDRWRYYFDKVIKNDEIILTKTNSTQIGHFSKLLNDNKLTNFTDLPKFNQFLYEAIVKNNYRKASQISSDLYDNIKKNKK